MKKKDHIKGMDNPHSFSDGLIFIVFQGGAGT